MRAALVGTIVATCAAAAAATPVMADVKAGVDAWQQGDYARAIAEWRPMATAGDADAQFNLGQAYKLGRGVPVDMPLALEWFRKAGAQGHQRANDNYGLLLFQQGKREEAMPYIRKSADRGEPRAQYILGTALFNGDLAPKDWVTAYALMTRAASSGLEQATTSLAVMDRYIATEQRQKGLALATDMARAPKGPDYAAASSTSTASAPARVTSSTPVAPPAPKPARPVSPPPRQIASPAVPASNVAPPPRAAPPSSAAPPPRYETPPYEPPIADPPSRSFPASPPIRSSSAKPPPSRAMPPPRPSLADPPPPTHWSSAESPPPEREPPPVVRAAPPAARPPGPALTAAPVARPPMSGSWRIQMGAFREEPRAHALWQSATSRVSGLSAYKLFLDKGGGVTRVQAGPLRSEADAASLCGKLRAAGYACLIKHN